MLPIFDKSDKPVYTEQDVRQVGYWVSPTGKKYSFLDTGRIYKGRVSRSFSFTQPKNYPMQGTGGDIQALTTAALLKALISRSDVIRMVNEVHDSKWLYIREDKLHDVLFWLQRTLEDVPKLFKDRGFNLDIPFKFPIEFKVGQTFGEMTTYEF